MADRLELHLTLAAGREADCAAFLREQLGPRQWKILASLAAEVVATHEREAGLPTLVLTDERAIRAACRELGIRPPGAPADKGPAVLDTSK